MMTTIEGKTNTDEKGAEIRTQYVLDHEGALKAFVITASLTPHEDDERKLETPQKENA